MNTRETNKEQISALVDGELADGQIDVALAALRQAGHHCDWETYHQIGDVLRSDDMAVALSAGFAARMAARLDAEPTIIAPAFADRSAASRADEKRARAKRWAMPGMVAAAAVATVAFITTPQLMVAMKGDPTKADPSVALVAASDSVAQPAVVSAKVPEGVVLRDPRIDDYLLAHQRFSPSVYSTAQYARSATFATDSTK